MRDRMEKLVILPFSFGCISEANVAVGVPHPRRSPRPADTNSPAAAIKGPKSDKDILESLSGESMMKNSVIRFHDAVPKSNTSPVFNRLFKGFKNFPQLFVDKEEGLEEMEMNMEIGFPTDVQHVTHIGWDGFAATATAKSHSSLPLQQFQLSTLELKPGTSSTPAKPSPN